MFLNYTKWVNLPDGSVSKHVDTVQVTWQGESSNLWTTSEAFLTQQLKRSVIHSISSTHQGTFVAKTNIHRQCCTRFVTVGIRTHDHLWHSLMANKSQVKLNKFPQGICKILLCHTLPTRTCTKTSKNIKKTENQSGFGTAGRLEVVRQLEMSIGAASQQHEAVQLSRNLYQHREKCGKSKEMKAEQS